ncbi:MAG TPA: PEPxxWA-CTERM sorting domain-containing protein, partial [Vicinamibacteria bacterium]|nr:PEPxxWA-CTERM sorting domain-containing protein [Vicinamibacteria bacterium]
AQNFFGAYSAGSRNYTLITPIQQYGGANGRTPLALTQSFVFASAPEPMTWALMIGGLGLTGVVLRRQRRAGAAVA